MKLTFLGAAETVTGSRFLLETANNKHLLIDCGLFQGLKKLRDLNWKAFPVKPASIDAVVLTHAHIDHSGYIPLLFKNGFRGKVYCTPATLDLCRILLPDSGHLHEEEAKYANRHGFSKHHPALPLYTREDAERCLSSFETIPYKIQFNPVPGVNVQFISSGHILGAACIQLTAGNKTVVFSGDVGRPVDPVMHPPEMIERADYLVVESTYGDRLHPKQSPKHLLERAISNTLKKGGTVLIPSFAVGRAQTVLHLITELTAEGKIPRVPVYLDSPMAIDATEIFYRYHQEHRLSMSACKAMAKRVTCTHTVEESKAISMRNGPKIIISASGMLTGGRILHHLKLYLQHRNNCVIFAGYQAAGTRGAAMLAGADTIKIHGQYIPVRARTVFIDGLSGHADYNEMIAWLSGIKIPPKQTFIVHGEPQSQDAFRRTVHDRLGWEVIIPGYGDTFELN